MAILSSSIARKVAMALSGLFLVLFLAQHFTINITSVIDPDTFNNLSHFMGHNFVVQFIAQPILIFGVVFHFIMGLVLEIRNRNARQISYNSFKGNKNSTWASRNMIISGAVILAFLGLHFYDFWFPEIVHKYVESNPLDATRYYPELLHKFESPVRTGLYCLAFVLLALHLWHGFSSSFQSMGWNNKYSKGLRGFTQFYAIFIPLGFIFIALYLHFNQ
ncbi:succinate dehydrogenase cytochrome b subunit [Aequorivita sp. F47161]|uniref:Succinate dehydrogenase cytochrome b subunit n=1 Tax=Aequorivita vitellina TaxID=2874475 RepID=A0A9X1QVC4_9FLAO|nr:succinate dehydrogenase cytochrome b subunit [Aequorivita vitellina]MCG2418077.1 succinate dehydrogenase cytochrome b subunit [Aequorivita vitellina]MCZ4317621.1 succinate dehydrogenase cytochrome b subunit [Aequorivita viscosa]